VLQWDPGQQFPVTPLKQQAGVAAGSSQKQGVKPVKDCLVRIRPIDCKRAKALSTVDQKSRSLAPMPEKRRDEDGYVPVVDDLGL